MIGAADEQELYERLVSVNQTPPILKRMVSGPAASDNVPAPALPDRTARLMYRDAVAYLPGDVLVKLDRASMAVGLEGRCPLLDHRVVEFAWRLPQSVKIHGGRGKWILRRVLRRYLPDSLFERPKHGFNVPIAAWLRGPLRGWAEDLLGPSRITREGLLDSAQVQTLLNEHLSRRRDHACALWAILMFEAWFDAAREAIQATTAKIPPAANDWCRPETLAAARAAPSHDMPRPITPTLQWTAEKTEAANGR